MKVVTKYVPRNWRLKYRRMTDRYAVLYVGPLHISFWKVKGQA